MKRAQHIRAPKSFKGAFKLHAEFRERKPTRVRKVKVRLPKAAAVMGPVDSISYRTTHKGKAVLYKHDFAPGSRPILAAGPGENELVLVGGRYHVTARGIVDLDAQGREIDDPTHGEEIKE